MIKFKIVLLISSLLASLLISGVPSEASQQAPGNSTASLESHSSATLHGEVSIDEAPDTFSSFVKKLNEQAFLNDKEIQDLERSVRKYKSPTQKLLHRSKDALNYVILYKGVSQSAEASDVILGEKKKLKSRASAELIKQRAQDELEVKVTTGLIELAMALGNPQSTSADIDQAKQQLIALVGQDKANDTEQYLKGLASDGNFASTGQPVWSVGQKSKRQNYLSDTAFNADPIAKQTVDLLHRYNHVSKIVLGSHRAVRTALGIASLSPTLVAPCAQAALFAWVMATGGSEEDKLLKEVYLSKSLNSRYKSISEQAHLALDYYQLAQLTKNPVLLGCCRNLIEDMSGETSGTVLSAGDFTLTAQPIELPAEAKSKTAERKTKSKKLTSKQQDNAID